MRDVEQKELRGNGKLRTINIVANNLAEATHKTIIACHDKGFRVETPKQTLGMTLGYDASITVCVKNPDSEPKLYIPGIHDDGRGLMQYILEVTHGIHNHWKKNSEHPEWWGYTYNERFVGQIPFVLERIKHDWNKRRRISGRDYMFAIWRSGEDITLEQEDPPCFQLGQFRFIDDSEGNVVLNYETNWRSRDLLKAWNENNVAQIELMKLFRAKVSQMLNIPVKLGAYVDHSSSLHLYGLYIDRDNLEKQIVQMKTNGWKSKSMNLDNYLTIPPDMSSIPWEETITAQKRLIAAQMDYETKTVSLNASRQTLIDNDYNLDKFSYPEEWDTWPKSWDEKPDRSKLVKIL